MFSYRRVACVSISIGALTAGMLTAATIPAGASSGTTAPTIKVHVTQHHWVQMPHHLRPGVHKFRIRSDRPASFQIVRADAGYTKAEASRDINRGMGQNNVRALKRFENHVTLTGGATSAPGHPGVMWSRVTPGRYWTVDTNARVTRAAKLHTVRVSGARLGGHLPGTATVRAVNETDWAARPRAINHRGRLTFRNSSEDNHFVLLGKLAAGKTYADYEQWVEDAKNGGDSPPPIDFRHELDTGVASPGHAMTVRYALPRGNYVMTCFWPDADMGGMPHAFMGMNRPIRLR